MELTSYKYELKDLIKLLGKAGNFYYYVLRGIDKRAVITEFEPKTLSCETTFYEDNDNLDELLIILKQLAERFIQTVEGKRHQGQNLTLKIKYDNFELITRSCNTRSFIDEG